jgi:hypothetical protein
LESHEKNHETSPERAKDEQTSQMMGNEQENLLKKYTTCSNTPGITEIKQYRVRHRRTDFLADLEARWAALAAGT